MSATSAAPPARPQSEMLEITSARGVAALAVVLYHVDAYCGGVLYEASVPTLYFGPLAVDFFFILSGFVLTHVYGASWREGRYSHADFVVRRFARIWPLHMACLLGVAAIVLTGSRFGLAPPWEPTLDSFIAHAAMLHATGLSSERMWNQPSWSVSAEWIAYLSFPLYLMLAARVRTTAARLAAAAVLLAAIWAGVWILSGADFFTMKTGGALRIVPLFFSGVVLRDIMSSGVGGALGASALTRLIGATLAALFAGMTLGVAAALLWPALLVLLYLLTLRAQLPETNVFRARPFVWFGEISYAFYLVHAAVLMVTYGIGGKLLAIDGVGGRLALGAAAIALAIVAAAVGHYVVERPAQRLILSRWALRTRSPPTKVPAAP